MYFKGVSFDRWQGKTACTFVALLVASGQENGSAPKNSAFAFKYAGKCFSVSHRVIHWVVIVRGDSETFPFLSAAEVAAQTGVKVTDASRTEAKRIVAQRLMKADTDPHEVKRRIVADKYWTSGKLF